MSERTTRWLGASLAWMSLVGCGSAARELEAPRAHDAPTQAESADAETPTGALPESAEPPPPLSTWPLPARKRFDLPMGGDVCVAPRPDLAFPRIGIWLEIPLRSSERRRLGAALEHSLLMTFSDAVPIVCPGYLACVELRGPLASSAGALLPAITASAFPSDLRVGPSNLPNDSVPSTSPPDPFDSWLDHALFDASLAEAPTGSGTPPAPGRSPRQLAVVWKQARSRLSATLLWPGPELSDWDKDIPNDGARGSGTREGDRDRRPSILITRSSSPEATPRLDLSFLPRAESERRALELGLRLVLARRGVEARLEASADGPLRIAFHGLAEDQLRAAIAFEEQRLEMASAKGAIGANELARTTLAPAPWLDELCHQALHGPTFQAAAPSVGAVQAALAGAIGPAVILDGHPTSHAARLVDAGDVTRALELTNDGQRAAWWRPPAASSAPQPVTPR